MEDIIKKPGEENLKRNLLTLRLSDAEHQGIVNACWAQHRSCSSLLRELVLEYLQRQQAAEAGAPSPTERAVS